MPELIESPLASLLAAAVERNASDLHLKVGAAPHLRVDGRLGPLDMAPLVPADTERLAYACLPEHLRAAFESSGEADFALSLPGVGRFRVNVHRQRGSIGLVLRRVLPGIPSLGQLGLPPAVAGLADQPDGLVLVTGPAGSGTSTTLAALVDRVNATRACSILTIEDPVEVLHQDKQGIVVQREVGTDTPDVLSALTRAWRQDPDVVVLGHLHQADVVAGAMSLAETGHLVLASLTTASAAETCNRLLEVFPVGRQAQVRATLARVLRGTVSQRLLERADGRGRTPAAEVCIGTARIQDRIAETAGPIVLDDLLIDGEYYGMQTFDQSLFALCRSGMIGVREAVAAAHDPPDLKLSLQHAGLLPY